MNTNPNMNLLYKIWEENQTASSQAADVSCIDFEFLVPSMFSAGPMYYYIIDFFDMSISNVSDSIQTIHGLDPALTTFKNILDRIHPDDMEHVSRSEKVLFEKIIAEIGFGNSTKYKMQYCFRFKTADSTYKLFLHQAIVLSTDNENKISKSLNIHTDISAICSTNNFQVSLIGMLGEPSYINLGIDNNKINGIKKNDLQINKTVIFSNREMEILKMISNGLTNATIADKLSIAMDTVKNHRRNIMKKAGVKNTASLISKCMMDGLI